MSGNLHAALFQFDICWNDIKANRQKVQSVLDSCKNKPDILFLPETYSTGFVPNPRICSLEQLQNQTDWQQALSDQYKLAIAGSVIMFENEKFYNRMVFTRPDKAPDFYTKRHLFRMGNENKLFESGRQRKVFDLDGVKIMPQICYDLRFPVWTRNNLNYQVLFYSANWPAPRQLVWETLLRARAIENQCYVVGINRIGTDGTGINYKGGSVVYGPSGEELFHAGTNEHLCSFYLSLKALKEFRESFPAYLDADEFEIKNRD